MDETTRLKRQLRKAKRQTVQYRAHVPADVLALLVQHDLAFQRNGADQIGLLPRRSL